MKKDTSLSTQRRLPDATYNRMSKMVRIICICLALVVLMSVCAFAEDDVSVETQIENGIKTGMGSIYSILTKIVVPIAAVVFTWSAFQILFGSERDTEAAKKRLIITAIAVAIVMLGPLVINAVSTWFSTSASDSSTVFSISD